MIKNTLSISYKAEQSGLFSAVVSYEIDMNDNIQTLTCHIADGEPGIPSWCQPRKFAIRSLYSDKAYVLLYNENKEIRHIDMALFMEKIYSEIMTKEKRKQAEITLY